MRRMKQKFPDGAAAADLETLTAAFDATVAAAHIPAQATVCVALSGGMDSRALLEVARRRQWRVSACHVNHGISRRADQWEEFCRRQCAAAQVPLTVHRAAPPPQQQQQGQTPASEDWARQVRRQVFASLPVSAVVTAHHADDQAETLLFRLLRGGSVRGLSAMQPCTNAGGMTLLRPWLHIERRVIAAYAAARRLRWIEDEDNRNVARHRNALRWRVLPLLEQAFGGCAPRLGDAAQRFAESAALLQQLAAHDDTAAALPNGGNCENGGWSAAYFREQGAARLRNWLYHALRARTQPFSEAQLHEAARQLLGGKCAIKFESMVLHSWRDSFYWDAPPPALDSLAAAAFQRELSPSPQGTLAAGRTALPELGGQLVLAPAAAPGRGLSPAKIKGALTIKLRQGGERLAPPRRPTRRVATLLQEAAVPPWRRQRLPLLYAGAELAAVANVAVAQAFSAAADETGLECFFEWK